MRSLILILLLVFVPPVSHLAMALSGSEVHVGDTFTVTVAAFGLIGQTVNLELAPGLSTDDPLIRVVTTDPETFSWHVRVVSGEGLHFVTVRSGALWTERPITIIRNWWERKEHRLYLPVLRVEGQYQVWLPVIDRS